MVPAIRTASAGRRTDDGRRRRRREDGCRVLGIGGSAVCGAFRLLFFIRAGRAGRSRRVRSRPLRLFRLYEPHIRLILRLLGGRRLARLARLLSHMLSRLLSRLLVSESQRCERGRVVRVEAASRALEQSRCFREALSLCWRRVKRANRSFWLERRERDGVFVSTDCESSERKRVTDLSVEERHESQQRRSHAPRRLPRFSASAKRCTCQPRPQEVAVTVAHLERADARVETRDGQADLLVHLEAAGRREHVDLGRLERVFGGQLHR